MADKTVDSLSLLFDDKSMFVHMGGSWGKTQEINIINTFARRLDPDAPAKELHKIIMEYVLTDEGEQPTEVALQLLTDESRRVLTHGPQA